MRVIGILLLLLSASVAFAADVAGVWTLSYTNEEGQTRESALTLKAEGAKLAGTISSLRGQTPIADGTIAGNDISFLVIRKGNGDEIRIAFNGKVEGDSMKLTMQLRDRTPIRVTAKRAAQ